MTTINNRVKATPTGGHRMNVAERAHQKNIAITLLTDVITDILQEVEDSDERSISLYDLCAKAGFSSFGSDDVYVVRYVVKELLAQGVVKTTPDDLREISRWNITLA